MNIISTIILVLFSLGAIGQQQEFNYDNTIVHIVNGNINHFRRIVNCPLLEIKQNEIPTTILSSVNKHILSRLGPTFFKKLKLPNCYQLRRDLTAELNKVKPNINIDFCDTSVLYAIQYHFDVEWDMKYYFTILISEDQKISSKEQLPDINIKENAYKFISLKSAIKKANSDSVYKGKSYNITLEYADSLNSFVWLIQKGQFEGETESEIKTPLIIMDANSGLIIHRYLETSYSGCTKKPPAFPGLKRGK